MSGPELYAMYTEANLELECGVEDWDQLEDDDRESWTILAARLEPVAP